MIASYILLVIIIYDFKQPYRDFFLNIAIFHLLCVKRIVSLLHDQRFKAGIGIKFNVTVFEFSTLHPIKGM